MSQLYWLAMYQIYRYTTSAIEKSIEDLNNIELYGDVYFDKHLLDMESKYFEDTQDSDDDDDSTSNRDDGDDEDGTDREDPEQAIGLGNRVLRSWKLRFGKLAHPYVIAGWALSVYPHIRENAKNYLTGEHRLEIEKVIAWLHAKPCANPDPGVVESSEQEVIDILLTKFKCFRNKTDMFSNEAHWATGDVFNGSSWLWQENIPSRTNGFLVGWSIGSQASCVVSTHVRGTGAT